MVEQQGLKGLIPVIFILLVFGFCSCSGKASIDPLDEAINQTDARDDFRVFREILEDAHPALTDYITAKEKNRLFDSLNATINSGLSLRDFYKKLAYVANKTGCSHTYTSLAQQVSDTLFNRPLFFPFPVILIGDGLYINSDEGLDHGTKLISINGIPVSKILDTLVTYNPIEGRPRITQRYASAGDFSFDYYVHFGAPEKFELLMKDTSGSIKTKRFSPITLTELQERNTGKYYFDATDVDYSFIINEEKNYALLRLPTFELGSNNQQTAFEHFLKNSFDLLSKRKEIRDLVIDLRENTGGDLYNCFLLHSYISTAPFAEYQAVFSRVKKVPFKDLLNEGESADVDYIERRLKNDFIAKTPWGYNIPDSLISRWDPDANRFTGNVFIITNHRVSSAASYFTLLSTQNARAKVIGTETGGGSYSGNGFKMLEYMLPHSKIRFGFPYAKMIYSFHLPKTGRGIIPDYLLPDNYDSFLKNEDRQLIFITDSLISKKR